MTHQPHKAVTKMVVQHGFGARLSWFLVFVIILSRTHTLAVDITPVNDDDSGSTDPTSPAHGAMIPWALSLTEEEEVARMRTQSKTELIQLHIKKNRMLTFLEQDLSQLELDREKEVHDLRQSLDLHIEELKRMEGDVRLARTTTAADAARIEVLQLEVQSLEFDKKILEERLEAYDSGAGRLVNANLAEEEKALKEKLKMIEELDKAYDEMLRMKREHGVRIAATDEEVKDLLSMVQSLQAHNRDLLRQLVEAHAVPHPRVMGNSSTRVSAGNATAFPTNMSSNPSSRDKETTDTDGKKEEGQVSYLIFEGCQTVKCVSGKFTELSFEFMWQLFSDPLSLGRVTWNQSTQWIVDNTTVISCILGAGILFVCSNLIIYTVRKFAKVCQVMYKAWNLFLHLPVVAIFSDFLQMLIRMMISSAEDVKNERQKISKENKEMKAALDKMFVTMKEISKGTERVKRDAEAMMRQGRAAEWGRNVEERLSRPPQWNRPPPGPSDRQGGRGPTRWGPNGGRNVGGNRGGRSNAPPVARTQSVVTESTLPVSTKRPDSPRPAGDAKPSTSKGNAPAVSSSEAGIGSQIGQLLYAPIHVNGVRMPRCLIDTGAQVNLIPKKDVVKQGWMYDLAGAKTISGFSGDTYPMDGVLRATVTLGPATVEEAEFQVCPKISVPILGIHTLSEMGFVVNCKKGTLCVTETGQHIQCSVVHSQKN